MLQDIFSFVAGEALFKDLVLNSAISFEAFKILDMSFYEPRRFHRCHASADGTDDTVPEGRKDDEGVAAEDEPYAVAAWLACAAGGLPAGYRMHRLGHTLRAAALSTVILWQRRSYSEVSLIILFSVLTGIFATALVLRFSDIKENRNMKVMAISLANDNDMVAEGMLIDMWPKLENDTAPFRNNQQGKDLSR